VAKRNPEQSITAILGAVSKAGNRGDIVVADIVDALGRNSFGALLLVPSLILISPISGIPGAPTFGAIVIVLIAGQMLIGRQTIWLPDFIRHRTIGRERMRKAIGTIKPAAAFLDRFVGRRLVFLVRRPFDLLLLIPCIVLAIAMPVLELVPMSSTVLASAIFLIALALTVRDGVVALIAIGATALVAATTAMLLF